jgi:hypothetical protein
MLERDTYVMSVAMLLMEDMRPMTMAQDSSEPWMVDGWRMIGPAPPALTRHQIKNVMPAVGATMAFTVNRCRL